MMSYSKIDEMLNPLGLCLRGGFREEQTTLLVGNVGSEIWQRFGQEYEDWVEPDPLDNWTRRHLSHLADELNCTVVFPFEGPDYAPFQTWAMQADCVFPSPLGPLIHPVYGMWHAYRGAFVFHQPIEGMPPKPEMSSPCSGCQSKPCLKTCPVGAFHEDGYTVSDCLEYLGRKGDSDCMTLGCLARRACPVGEKFSYHPAHAQFHMDRFLCSAPLKP